MKRKMIAKTMAIVTMITLIGNYIMAYFPPKEDYMLGAGVVITIAFAIISVVALFNAYNEETGY